MVGSGRAGGVLRQALGGQAGGLADGAGLSPSPPLPPPPAAGRRARGISVAAARQMLVYSFGREVVEYLGDEALMGRVEAAVLATLADAPLAAA